MRKISLIIIHCSATKCNRPYSFESCKLDHIKNRHFRDIGYHYYIERDGSVHQGRALEQIGAHCNGHNRHSVGICYEGGLDERGRPSDTRTEAQRKVMHTLVEELQKSFPDAIVVGHHDLNPYKACPCFDV